MSNKDELYDPLTHGNEGKLREMIKKCAKKSGVTLTFEQLNELSTIFMYQIFCQRYIDSHTFSDSQHVPDMEELKKLFRENVEDRLKYDQDTMCPIRV